MYHRIVVPVDGSPAARRALSAAARAAAPGALLRLVHVLQPDQHATGFETAAAYIGEVLPRARVEGRALLEQARAALAPSALAVECALLEPLPGGLGDALLADARAWDADLIVMGTHGRRGLERLLLGSDAEAVVRRSALPVMLVRAPAVPAAPQAA